MRLFGERQTKATLDELDARNPPCLGSIELLKLMWREFFHWRLVSLRYYDVNVVTFVCPWFAVHTPRYPGAFSLF